MFHRLAALGGPPLLLILVTFLLVRYQASIQDALWQGGLPQAWRSVLQHLPAVLAAAGMLAALRLRSCGIMIIMATLAALHGVLTHGGIFGIPPQGTGQGVLPGFLILMPVNYLLGLWVLRHSWQSQRGLAALAGVAVAAGFWWYWLRFDLPPLAEAVRFPHWLADLPINVDLLPHLQDVRLPAVLTAVYLALRAFRTHDAVAAGLSASLVVILPAFTRALAVFPQAVVSNAAVLVVLLGILESMLALAYRDGLTGLPGRRALNDMLAQLGRRYAIAMLDVDHFKRFNDRFGHRTGDDVLKMIASRMRRIPGGRAFRYGGEEFAVIFKGSSASMAADRMEQFREALARTPFVIRRLPRADRKARNRPAERTSSRQGVRITVSIGVAAPGKGRPEALAVLAAADKALYRAKKAGRNRVVDTSPHLRSNTTAP